jgi:hypothetical protein
MHSKFLIRNALSAASAAARVVLVFIILAPTARTTFAEETTPCVLETPKYQAKGGKVNFEITLNCNSDAAANPVPLGTDILVGLTVYDGSDVKKSLLTGDEWFVKRKLNADSEAKAALKDTPQSNSIRVEGAPKWIILTDANAASFDFPTKLVKVKQKGERITVKFQGNQKSMGEKRHYLFAAWPASARTSCEKNAKLARSGCRRDGFVIGDDSGVYPLAVYPGLEVNYFSYPGGDWTVERWIVERFR